MSLISALSGPIAAGGAAISDALSRLSSKPSPNAAVQAHDNTNTSPSDGSSGASGTSGSSSTDPNNPLGSESTFLSLLVSQLQNQDPLNPTDSNQFVSQLTSFSQLEQLINIAQNTSSLASAVSPSASSTSSGNSGTSSSGN